MSGSVKLAPFLAAIAVLALALAGCGSASSRHATASGGLRSFQHADVGERGADDAPTWEQYGARPVGRTLTLNPMTLDNTGSEPVVLLGVRQVRPVRGLVFGTAQVTLTPGFTGYGEYVSLGQPAGDFDMHANFSPLHGFIVNPNPQHRMSGVAPTVVMTVRATRPGMFHIGDWMVSYRVGRSVRRVRLVDDGEFCAGAGARSCPGL